MQHLELSVPHLNSFLQRFGFRCGSIETNSNANQVWTGKSRYYGATVVLLDDVIIFQGTNGQVICNIMCNVVLLT